MKSKFFAIPLFLIPTTATVLTTVSCGKVFPTSIKITGKSVVFIGQKDPQYKANVEPDVLSRNIYWTIDDTSIAEIDEYGILHAIKPGHVTIRARARSVVSSVIGIKDVYVCYEPKNISIDGDDEAYIDRLTQYKATVTSPKGETIQDVSWFLTDESGEALDPDIATIDGDGWLNPSITLREDVTINVNAKCLYNKKIVASKPVKMTVPTPEYVSIRLSRKLTVGYPETITLEDNIMERALEASWEYNNEYLNIESIGERYYTITPIKITSGEKINIKGTSTQYPDLSDEKKIEIVNPPESITIVGKSQLRVGDTEPYTQTILPEEAVQDVFWSIINDDESEFAEINPFTGIVTAKKPIENLIICASSWVDPTIFATFNIQIVE